MKINPETNKPFTSLELSSIARKYYIEFKSVQVYYGFNMLVATDGINTMNVLPDYIPETEDIRVFYLTVRRQADKDGFTNHIGIWDMTDVLPACDPLPSPAQLHEGWNVLLKRATPEYYRKNGISYRNGRPDTERDQDLYDQEKNRRKYKHREDYGAYLEQQRLLGNNIN